MYGFGRKNFQSNLVPEWRFFENLRVNIKYSHCDPKGTSLPGTTSFDVFAYKSVLGVGYWRTPLPQNQEITSHPKGTAKSRIWGAETPEPITTKFCMSGVVYYMYIITHANFDDKAYHQTINVRVALMSKYE